MLQTALLQELLSPLITPLILIFKVRHSSLEIVDFYRNFTVDVSGVGDVCSFAQMNIRKHGNKKVCGTEASSCCGYTLVLLCDSCLFILIMFLVLIVYIMFESTSITYSGCDISHILLTTGDNRI